MGRSCGKLSCHRLRKLSQVRTKYVFLWKVKCSFHLDPHLVKSWPFNNCIVNRRISETLVTSMLVTDVGDEMFWSQLLDVGDGFGYFGYKIGDYIECYIYFLFTSRTNIQKMSPTSSHQHHCQRITSGTKPTDRSFFGFNFHLLFEWQWFENLIKKNISQFYSLLLWKNSSEILIQNTIQLLFRKLTIQLRPRWFSEGDSWQSCRSGIPKSSPLNLIVPSSSKRIHNGTSAFANLSRTRLSDSIFMSF